MLLVLWVCVVSVAVWLCCHCVVVCCLLCCIVGWLVIVFVGVGVCCFCCCVLALLFVCVAVLLNVLCVVCWCCWNVLIRLLVGCSVFVFFFFRSAVMLSACVYGLAVLLVFAAYVAVCFVFGACCFDVLLNLLFCFVCWGCWRFLIWGGVVVSSLRVVCVAVLLNVLFVVCWCRWCLAFLLMCLFELSLLCCLRWFVEWFDVLSMCVDGACSFVSCVCFVVVTVASRLC